MLDILSGMPGFKKKALFEKLSRRDFLRYSGAGLSASLLSGCDSGFIMKRFFSRPPKNTPFITPTEAFYIVQYSGPQRVDVNQWSLEVGGRVRKALTLRYEDLLKRPAVEKMVTLMCIDNEVAGEQIGNALWKGISLRALLEEAVPEASVVDVAMFGADDYSDSITLDRAMNYDVFLAYEMNGKPLTTHHGYPLRAVVPGLYGIKNVKWLTKIELTNRDYKGYWQKKSWTDRGIIKVTSRIDDPGPYNTLSAGYVLRGLAFGGFSGIGMVELSFDGAKTWKRARLDPGFSAYSWVFWRYVLENPVPGETRIYVRATTKVGQTQTDFMARAFPEGTSGLHSVIAFVE